MCVCDWYTFYFIQLTLEVFSTLLIICNFAVICFQNSIMMPHKRKGRDGGTLIRSLSESSPNKANRLYRRVLTDVRVFPNKIPHFLFTMALFGITLPSQQSLPPAFWDFFCLCLLDRQMQDDLVAAKVINWCSNFTPLSILSTARELTIFYSLYSNSL